jgi:hypothetical protein
MFMGLDLPGWWRSGGSSISTAALNARVPLSNPSAAGAPTVNDDTNAGYAVGSYWRKASTGREWICTNAAAGAAVWMPLQAQARPAQNEGVYYDNIGSVNASGINNSPQRTYSPVTLHSLDTWNAEIYLTTAQAGAEITVAIHDCDEYGQPGPRISGPTTADLSTGSASVKTVALAWSNARLGRFWVMQALKAVATQATVPRIGDGVAGVITGTTSVAAATLMRYRTEAGGTYAAPTADPSGTTVASNGSDCPVGWLKRTNA